MIIRFWGPERTLMQFDDETGTLLLSKASRRILGGKECLYHTTTGLFIKVDYPSEGEPLAELVSEDFVLGRLQSARSSERTAEGTAMLDVAGPPSEV